MKCHHPHKLMHYLQLSCFNEWQVVIMHDYEVATMHVSKPCYISMCSGIDEPFMFNANLQHILVYVNVR